jgi:hypothetical protein
MSERLQYSPTPKEKHRPQDLGNITGFELQKQNHFKQNQACGKGRRTGGG